jgi:hypothetical protein
MTRTFTTFLLDMAMRIAPAHRREWIEGLRAEAGLAAHPAGWAWGAVSTALRERLSDTVVSGLALRGLLGGFVICVAAALALFIGERIPGIEATAVRAHRDLWTILVMPAGFILLLLSGGLAILFSSGNQWLNRYGRALFGLGGLGIGFTLAWAGYESTLGHTATVLQRQVGMLSAMAGPLFVAAALALVFRRGRLFGVLASGALGMEIAQYGVALSHLHLHQAAVMAVAFFSACAPALLLLAGGGLLVGRRTPAGA